ncbi:hypothetical protein H6504_00765 [Candidatus Woesearchaeota archaeon]|nr:hypothetical protein [Candidatus Woesearchaeota archaeon]
MKRNLLLLTLLIAVLAVGCAPAPTTSCPDGTTAMTDIYGNTVCLPEDNSSVGEDLEEAADGLEDDSMEESAEEPTDEKADEEDMADISSKSELPRKEVKEGELVGFPNLKAVDPEGDELTYSYSDPLDESGEWQTKKGDAGEYIATITVSDGVNDVTQDVLIIVNKVNVAPTLAPIDDITVVEGEMVVVTLDVNDEDGDELSIEFSEPLDDEGEWKTEKGQAGEYLVEVEVSDETEKVSEEFIITVLSSNKPPVITEIDDVEVEEGEIISFNPTAYDPEGEEISIAYSGWMSESSYKTTFDDEGVHVVVITVSDGELESTEEVKVTVLDVNRPPMFVGGSFK